MKDKLSTIFATRRGFLYQDKFAVLTYLEHFQAKNIEEFYIDYVWSGQKSIDVRLVDRKKLENVYEIKSGEAFKLDKRKKESSEIRNAFIDLHNYHKNSKDAKLNLIIRKGFKPKISTYWDKIQTINKRYTTLKFPPAKEAISWLFLNLDIPNIYDVDSLYFFCKILNLDDSHQDELYNRDDEFSDIEKITIQIIDTICKLFNAGVCIYEFPSKILFFEMLHICATSAGTNENLHPKLTELIIQFITSRRLLDNNPVCKKSITRNEIYENVKKEFDQWYGLILSENKNISSKEVPELKGSEL